VSGLHFGPDNLYIPGVGYEGSFLILSSFDNSGSNVESSVINSINAGDVLRISIITQHRLIKGIL
jgi:hypothetical protein